MLLLCAELRDEPLLAELTLVSRGVKAITHHDTQSPSRSIMQKTTPRTAQGRAGILQLLPRRVDLGQNLPGVMLRVFQHKGTFASLMVTHRALWAP